MARAFFEAVDDALRGFLPPDMRGYAVACTSWNLKVWYEEPREHYECQQISASTANASKRAGPYLEIGYHAEHPDAEANDRNLAALQAAAKSWRKSLGDEPEIGAFLGTRTRVWRRISEVWDKADQASPELAIEAAERLAAYISAIEPARLRRVGSGSKR